jgi:tungstate transport system substrate-binding protein
MKPRNHGLSLAVLLCTSLLWACGPASTPAVSAALASEAPAAASTVAPTAVAAPSNPDVILATTTSTQDSGLLDVLVPLFEQETGYKLKVVAVGTGQALQMGQEGNADVLLVHAPSSEQTYMDGGYGKERFLIMHNDFIVVGPASDPAGIKGDPGAADAFEKIAIAEAPFISRGDKSGTNTKELALWKIAGIDVSQKPAWYTESGQGMGATLTIASEKNAYTLTDRATYLANKANLQLDLLVEKDNSLLNVYHVITVNPEKWPKINYDGAIAFAKWLTEPSTQTVIGSFGLDKFGQALFIPDADKTDADLGL